jgi:hypothetical protein
MRPDDLKLTNKQKVFLRAADILRERDWCQGDYFLDKYDIDCDNAVEALDKGIKFCFAGAVATAIESLHVEGIHVEGITYPNTSIKWNDTPGRTKEEVIARLEEMAWQQQRS